MKMRAIRAEIQQLNQSPRHSDDSLNTDSDSKSIKTEPSPPMQSSPIVAPKKRRSLPLNSSSRSPENDCRAIQIMTDLQNQLKKKDDIIEQLKQMLEVTKQRERERDAPNGLVGHGNLSLFNENIFERCSLKYIFSRHSIISNFVCNVIVEIFL